MTKKSQRAKRISREEKPAPATDIPPTGFDAATQAALAARDRPSPNAPKEPPMETIRPAIGPNVDGWTHLAVLSHATDEDERALLASELEARNGDTPPKDSTAPNAAKE